MRPKFLGPGAPPKKEPWWLNKVDSERTAEFRDAMNKQDTEQAETQTPEITELEITEEELAP